MAKWIGDITDPFVSMFGSINDFFRQMAGADSPEISSRMEEDEFENIIQELMAQGMSMQEAIQAAKRMRAENIVSSGAGDVTGGIRQDRANAVDFGQFQSQPYESIPMPHQPLIEGRTPIDTGVDFGPGQGFFVPSGSRWEENPMGLIEKIQGQAGPFISEAISSGRAAIPGSVPEQPSMSDIVSATQMLGGMKELPGDLQERLDAAIPGTPMYESVVGLMDIASKAGQAGMLAEKADKHAQLQIELAKISGQYGLRREQLDSTANALTSLFRGIEQNIGVDDNLVSYYQEQVKILIDQLTKMIGEDEANNLVKLVGNTIEQRL